MKKSQNPFYIRLEFSNEAGKPEGGDILSFGSLKDLQKIANEIVAVANEDKVAVNLTIGRGEPFFGFLKSFGLSRSDVENEMVDTAPTASASKKSTSKKASTQKKAVKAKKK